MKKQLIIIRDGHFIDAFQYLSQHVATSLSRAMIQKVQSAAMVMAAITMTMSMVSR